LKSCKGLYSGAKKKEMVFYISGGARHKQQQGPMTMSTEKVRKEIELQEPQSLY
jgi:hypothetical protein